MLFLAMAVAVGQTQQASDAITGRVVNENGQSLPNAHVWAHVAGSQDPPQSLTTDREGNFKLTALPRVQYQFSASMPAYMPAPRTRDTPTHYQVGDSVTLVLTRGGVITGKVTTAEGEPIVAIEVRVEAVRHGNGQKIERARAVKSGPTDDRGVYRFYGLPTGTYLVVAGGEGHDYSNTGINAFESYLPTYSPSSTRDTAAEISVRAGEETADVDIRYRREPARVISGSASGPPGENSVNVVLTSIGDGGAQTNRSTHLEPGGRDFVFNGITDGDYYVTAQSTFSSGNNAVSDSKLINVRGADVTGIELVMQPLGSISGRVVLEEIKAVECTDKQPPVFADTIVTALPKGEDTKDRALFVWSWQEPGKADGEGKIRLFNLAPGEYRFVTKFSAKDWYLRSISFIPSATKTPAAKPIDATKIWTRIKYGDRLTGLTVTLAQGAASLSGELALSEGQSVPQKLVLYLVPAEREKVDEVLRFYAEPVSANRKVELNNLAPGRYWILAQPALDGVESPSTKLRLPDASGTRARLRREAEAAKTEIEFKPCQKVVDFRIPVRQD